MAKTVDPKCKAFHLGMEILARPWNGLILNVLLDGPLRYGQIAELAHGPSDKILSARLKDLEAQDLLVRRVDAGPPVKVSYKLTPKGRSFGKLALAIQHWGRQLRGVRELEPEENE